MTVQNKQILNDLRREGLNFVEIAARMGLPVTTVKSYCYRHPLIGETEQPKEGCCPQCGAPIPKSKFRPRKFCSDDCRRKYWAMHPDRLDRKALISVPCAACGKPFSDYAYRGRKYCSHSCYISARYGGGKND